MKNNGFTLRKRLRSFGYAFHGIRLLITQEANAWIHCFAAVCVVVAGFFFGISMSEWIAVIFAIGMVLFFMVHFVFKRLARWSITAISFIYVFTVMTVLGFAIEIGQRITGTGDMDFGDVISGLYGVLVFFLIYSAYRIVVFLITRLVRRVRANRSGREEN